MQVKQHNPVPSTTTAPSTAPEGPCRAAWQVPCKYCWALRGDPCDGGGAHVFRLAAAYRAGLITEAAFLATVRDLGVFSAATLIPSGGPR